MEACKAGGAGFLARVLYDFGNRNGDEGGQALHRRSGLRQILTGKGLFNMFTRKKTCGVCGYAGIDIDAAISQKHEYNKTRPYRHGGKKC